VRPLRKIVVCVNRRDNPDMASCGARGGEAIASALEQGLENQGLAVSVERFHCLGRCESGPNLRLAPAGPFYQQLTLADVPALLTDIKKIYRR
jgi:(2Fe-2S) ferredoxin